MKIVTSTEVKNTFGKVMDNALVEPVLVKKSGRSSVVILSATEYERLSAIEDAYLASRAIAAKQAGYADDLEVQRLLKVAEGA